MANTLREISSICRFCLCQDEKLLTPIQEIVASILSTDDIERFTGIQIIENYCYYVICLYCTKKLEEYVCFRTLCMNNDVHFKKLCQMHITEICEKTNGYVSDSEKDPLASNNTYNHDIIVEKEKLELELDQSVVSDGEDLDDAKAVDWFYSANSIMAADKLLTYTDEMDDDYAQDSMNGEISKKPILLHAKRQIKGVHKNHEIKHESKLRTNEKSNQLQSTDRKKQLCSLCGKLVTYMTQHAPCYTKNTKYACPYCPSKMTLHTNLNRHVQSVHLKKIVKSCEICNIGFVHYNSFNYHMRSQHGIGQSYDCKICFKKFHHSGALNDHFNRYHNNKPSYECVTCGKLFKIKRQLNIHQRVHSTDQPFACRICPKRFKSAYARKTHESTHSGTRFKCSLCDKSYRYKTLLNMHIRKLHQDQSNENLEDGLSDQCDSIACT